MLLHKWSNIGTSIHAGALVTWQQAIAGQHLDNRTHVDWLRVSANLIADMAYKYDLYRSRQAWDKWINEDPAKGLGRMHRVTKVATGWVPSLVAQVAHEGEGGDEDDFPEVSDDAVRQADLIPLSSQQEVDEEAAKWGKEWAIEALPPSIHWPASDQMAELQALSVDAMEKAAGTFPISTGLGWDRLHPRSIARCSVQALKALVCILLAIERLGQWPNVIGLVLICLLPKPCGGKRPIGLLPSIVRWWMRARIDVVRAWQTSNERAYFYAGKCKGAAVSAWKQAARAELAGTS